MEQKERTETEAMHASPVETLNSIPAETSDMQQVVEEDYTQLNKAELLKSLEKLISSGDILSVSRQVKMIKDHFIELSKEEYNEKLSKYIEEGGEKKDFSPAKSLEEQRFEELLKKYNHQKAEHAHLREKKLKTNLQHKQQLIEEVKKIADNAGGAAHNFKRIQEIQASWKETGPVPAQEADELWKNYKFNIDRYFDLLHLNNELRELNFKRNLELKTELCEKAEKLVEEPSLRKTFETLRTIQEQWREIGFAGKDNNDSIFERFKAAENKLADRKKIQQEQLLAKQSENLQAKMAICDELQALNQVPRKSHKEWQTANQQLDQLWERWRKIGPVPESDNENCWKTFKRLRQEFYHIKDAFYIGIRGEQDANLALRIVLCEKAEALQNNSDWGKTASILKRLQEEWKTIGPTPKHKGDKAWNRFRTACDMFFNNRKQHFATMDAALEQNADARRAIIEQLKTLVITDNTNQNITQLRDLQQSWINAGKAPENSFKQLNKAFKDALDEKMKQIQQSSGIDNTALSQMRYEQLLQTDEGRNELHKERSHLSDKVKKLRHEVTTQENNLSFFGKSKGAAQLLHEYTEKVEMMKKELKTLEKQLKAMPFI